MFRHKLEEMGACNILIDTSFCVDRRDTDFASARDPAQIDTCLIAHGMLSYWSVYNALLCMQAVFTLLDTLKQWLEERRPALSSTSTRAPLPLRLIVPGAPDMLHSLIILYLKFLL